MGAQIKRPSIRGHVPVDSSAIIERRVTDIRADRTKLYVDGTTIDRREAIEDAIPNDEIGTARIDLDVRFGGNRRCLDPTA
jgi:hypothetical protein